MRRMLSHVALLSVIAYAKRPRQEEIPMEGAGVAPMKDKKLEEWAEEWVEKRDEKANLAEDMTGLETKMLDRMAEKGISVFRFADKELRIKPGKNHVKVKTVKNEGAESGDSEGEQQSED